MKDQFGRKIEYLRISITDRCNLRCRYCMPETGVAALRHEDILSYEEILRAAAQMAKLGIRKVRVTGGEPLVRIGAVEFVRCLKSIDGIEKVVLTTNGVRLAELAAPLQQAGLDGVNLSLDTLDRQVFAGITRRDRLPEVYAGMQEALRLGLPLKLNCVPLQGIQEEALTGLAELAREHRLDVRFIELMPIGCARTAGLQGMPMQKVRSLLEHYLGAMLPVPETDSSAGPAQYYRLPGFAGRIGFIDAVGHKFCSGCNRVRLTADGFLKLCLNARFGLDVRQLLRSGAGDEALYDALRDAVYQKPQEHFFADGHYQAKDNRRMYQVGG